MSGSPASNNESRVIVLREARLATVLLNLHRRAVFVAVLGCLLCTSVIVALSNGPVHIAFVSVVGILVDNIGLSLQPGFSSMEESVVESIRLPRVLMSGLVGAGLAVSGAVLQGLFRNPLADPTLIGVSGGAALGAVTIIVLGPLTMPGALALLLPYLLPLAAFAGGVVTSVVVFRFSTVRGKTVVLTLLLAGIAFSALSGALTSLLIYIADDSQLRTLTFWLMGGFGGITWGKTLFSATLITLTLGVLPTYANALNASVLGESEARHLGFDMQRVKSRLIVCVALCVGASVAVSGIIGFVGLMTPHLVRLVVGPDHRYVLPTSALLGASLLVLADLLARVVVSPAELPIGIITAILGGPFFLWLLYRQRAANDVAL